MSDQKCDENCDDEGYSPPSKRSKAQNEPKKRFLNDAMCSTLDRFKISDRAAVYIIIQTVQALGLNIDAYVINRTTLRDKRTENRKKCAMNLKNNFQVVCIHDKHIRKDIIFSYVTFS